MYRTTLLYYCSIFILSIFLLEGCLPDPKSPNERQPSSNSTATATTSGKALFKEHCITCHGANGQMGLNGAKNLTESILDKDGRILLITKGKGVMPAFSAQLSEAQIKAVATYSMQFNKSL